MNETSRPWEVLLPLSRDADAPPLREQLEERLRDAVKAGTLVQDARLPSTRSLAVQLGISRGVVVEAYEQLASEGVLALRRGAVPTVASAMLPAPRHVPVPRPPKPKYDFTPTTPDLSLFPRTEWRRAAGDVSRTLPDAELGYAEPLGAEALRVQLAGYLARARGVVVDPAHVLVTAGFIQSLDLICRVLASRGARRIGLEDPCLTEHHDAVSRHRLVAVALPVDDDGVRTDALERAGVDAVVVAPAHQFPTGSVLAPERRRELLRWASAGDRLIVEDDYDAEFRYDHRPARALQGMLPDRVAYAGTASKTLAPGLRLGWLVLPEPLLAPAAAQRSALDGGAPALSQHIHAALLERGVIDRHLQRALTEYGRRRNVLLEELGRHLPDASVSGIAAGLHLVLTLSEDVDEQRMLAAAAERHLVIRTFGSYHVDRPPERCALVLGYGRIPTPAVPDAVAMLTEAVAAACGAA